MLAGYGLADAASFVALVVGFVMLSAVSVSSDVCEAHSVSAIGS